jgi:hypothetical protein
MVGAVVRRAPDKPKLIASQDAGSFPFFAAVLIGERHHVFVGDTFFAEPSIESA